MIVYLRLKLITSSFFDKGGKNPRLDNTAIWMIAEAQ